MNCECCVLYKQQVLFICIKKEKSYTYLFFKTAINRFAADKLYKGKKHIMPSLLNVQDNKDR